ncbi:MAG: hypothetical protein ACE5FU_03865 [Nitrospinota bacterium]
MTSLLEKVVHRASSFAQEEQDRLAGILLEEIVAEERWNSSFRENADKLGAFADQALTDFNSGFTEKLSGDKL